MTIWPAWQHFEGDTKGSIEVGKLADLVILSADPTAVEPDNLDQLKVNETIKEGNTIFVLKDGKRAENQLLSPGTKNAAFENALRVLYAEMRLARLPKAYRTADARKNFEEAFEPCMAALVFADAMHLRTEKNPELSSGD